MDFLYSRITVRGKDNLRKTLSNISVYPIPALDNHTEFNDEIKLDDGQWFRLEAFSAKDYYPEYLRVGINNIEVGDLSKDEFEKVKFLISYQNDKFYLFQKIIQASLLSKRKFLDFQDGPKLETNKTLLIINDIPDAIYNKETDELFFKDISRVRQFFKGIEELLKEATDHEIEDFLHLDFIKLENGFDKTKVSLSNRRRVRLARQQYDSLSVEDKFRMNEYIKKYRPQLNFDEVNNQFSLGSDEDFKNLIFGIDQRYYTTEVSNQQRVANSVTDI